jgi:pantoate--beta-alanine ligase
VPIALAQTIARVRADIVAARADGRTVAFVPTMGALHAGHLALVARAGELADLVVVSIFVNPLQFGPNEDLDKYPRTLDADLAELDALGVQLVFAPTVAEMYPDGQATIRISAGEVGTLFEGKTRPGHFDGVLTVVTKLVNVVRPDTVLFGQKDAQQVFLVKRMVRDLNIPVAVEVVPTVRQEDGLALSSRNRFLDPGQRREALVLSRALAAAAASAGKGLASAQEVALAEFEHEPQATMDYLAFVNPETFLPMSADYRGPVIALVAAKIGTTRLIDTTTIVLG